MSLSFTTRVVGLVDVHVTDSLGTIEAGWISLHDKTFTAREEAYVSPPMTTADVRELLTFMENVFCEHPSS